MRVICTLPFTEAEVISGVVFVPMEVAKKPVRVSDDMPDEGAERLLKIPGYERYRGSDDMTKAVDEAVGKFCASHRADGAALGVDDGKDRTIHELQENLRLTQQELDHVRDRNRDLEAENAALSKELGEPSMNWSRKKLEEKANDFGIPVSTGMKKEEILQAIETHIARKG